MTGADAGGGPHVIGWSEIGRQLPISVMAFSGNTGGVRVAVADVDGDGRPEILAAPGAAGSEVRIFDGRNYALRHRFTPYGTWGSGVYVAAADMTGDQKAEVVASTGPGCCTGARFFDPLTPRELAGFFLFGNQAVSGARIAAADFTGDGRGELAVVRAAPPETGRVSLYAMNGGGTPFRSFTAFAGDPESEVAAGNLAGTSSAEVVVSGQGQVRAYDVGTGTVLASLIPFGPQLRRIAVAVADVDGDGGNDIVTAEHTPDGLQVKSFDLSGRQLASFFALDAGLAAGASVAAADLTGDGRAEIVLGSGPTFGEERVAVFGPTGAPLGGFTYDEPFFAGGVRVALGDVLGDGQPEIVTAPGAGRAPEIRVYDHEFAAIRNPVASFLAYGSAFSGGVYVATGDVLGDRRPEIVTAPGPGLEPRVKLFAADGRELGSFLAFEADYRGGVRVALGDVDADGKAEIAVGRAAGPPQLRILDARGEQRIAIVPPTAGSGVEFGLADLAGDGRSELLISDPSGPGVLAILDSATGSVLARFPGRAGRATGLDVDGDGRDEIVVAHQSHGGRVSLIRGNGKTIRSFLAYPGFGGGVFVAAAPRSGAALSIVPSSLIRTVAGHAVRDDIATFTDALGRTATADFGVTVDWEDGNGPVPATVVSRGGGRFAVRGLKTYLSAASYAVDVTVRESGRSVHARTIVKVVPAILRATPVRATARAGRFFSGSIALVRDQNPLSRAHHFAVTVDWGDRRRTPGTMRRSGAGKFVVSGAHRYRRPARYRVVVRIVDLLEDRTVAARSTILVRR